MTAEVTVEGGSGVRRIRLRDFQMLSDSLPDYAGYDLGPASPELQLGTLGSCLAHTFLIQAALLQVPLDAVTVTVSADGDLRSGMAEFPDVPVALRNLRYTAAIASPAEPAALERLHAQVERTCPILNLIRGPHAVVGTLKRTDLSSPSG
jgi:uncharacterized OsmC-like protein